MIDGLRAVYLSGRRSGKVSEALAALLDAAERARKPCHVVAAPGVVGPIAVPLATLGVHVVIDHAYQPGCAMLLDGGPRR